MKKKTVLITGGTGLLGTHLILNKPDDFNIVATVHLFNKVVDAADVAYEKLDIKNRQDVTSLIDKYQPAVIIHTAAHGRVDFCEDNRQEAYATNYQGTVNIVDALKKYQGKIIFCSTNMTYDGLSPLYDEKSAQLPETYYGQLKVDAENYIKESGINFTIVRLMTMYGWNWQPERKNMVSMLIGKLKEKGKLWMTNDVYNNMLYAKEAAQFFWDACLNPTKSDKNIFNIAGLKCLNRFQVTQEACEVFNLDKELVAEVTSAYFSGQETPRSPNTCFKTDKANRELDFKPISIQEGLDHMKNNPLPERTRII
jgi:dTDP-4-dehydrorhamnose reductase